MKRLLRPGGGLLCVAIAIVLTAAPAMAGLPPYWLGPESGHYGTHMLLDNGEYQGATCVYNSSHALHKINIRRPIVFAFNRTSHTDTEWVGWRYVIEDNTGKVNVGTYFDWTNVAVGPIHQAKATDQANAQWKPMSYTFPSAPPLGAYRVSIQMFWYHPSQTALDGKALDVVLNYRVVDPSLGAGSSEYDCNSASVF
jgi:hypothetical protein